MLLKHTWVKLFRQCEGNNISLRPFEPKQLQTVCFKMKVKKKKQSLWINAIQVASGVLKKDIILIVWLFLSLIATLI